MRMSWKITSTIVLNTIQLNSLVSTTKDFLMAPSKLSEVDGLKLLLMYKERLETMLKRKSDALEVGFLFLVVRWRYVLAGSSSDEDNGGGGDDDDDVEKSIFFFFFFFFFFF